MAKTVDEIIGILDDMRSEDERSNKNFEKVLTDINAKLENISDNDLLETVRMYISELKKTLEDEKASALVKFEEINKQFEELISSQKELPRFENIKSLFNAHAINFNRFLVEARNKGLVIDGVERKVSELGNKIVGREEFKDILQDLSTDIITINANVEKTYMDIAEVIKKADVSDEIQSLAKQIDEISEDLSSKINKIPQVSVESLEQKIDSFQPILETVKDSLKTSFNKDSIEILKKFEKLEKDFKTIITETEFSGFKENLAEFVQKIIDNSSVLNSELTYATDRIEHVLSLIDKLEFKDDFDGVVSKITEVKENFLNLAKDNYINLSQKFDSLFEELKNNKEDLLKFSSVTPLFENISSSINDIRLSFENNSKMNYENLTNEIRNLKTEINTDFESKDNRDSIEKTNLMLADLLSSIQFLKDISANNQAELVQNISSFNNVVIDLKNDISENNESINENIKRLSEELNIRKTELEQNFKDDKEFYSEQLVQVNDKISGFRVYVEEVILSIKDYLQNLEVSSKGIKNTNKTEILQKISEIQDRLLVVSHEYDNKTEKLQEKIDEFFQAIEGSNSTIEGKIASSIEEFSSIKDELTLLDTTLKTLKQSNDEKFNQNISLLDAGVENIIFSINAINENVKNGVESSVKDGISSINDRISDFSEILLNFKKEDDSVDVIGHIEEKASLINEELKQICIDITESYQKSLEDVVRALEPVKSGIDSILGFDFEKIISELKTQLESSISGFSSDLTEKFASDSEILLKLKEAYNETYNKISSIEEVISERILNNIELVNASILSGIQDIKNNIAERFDEKISGINTNLDSVDKKIVDAIDSFQGDLVQKFDIISSSNSLLSAKQDEIYSGINNITDNIKSFIAVTFKNLEEKDSSNKVLSEISGIKSENDLIKEAVNTINSKVDIIVTDSSEENILEEIDILKESIQEQTNILEEKNTAIDKSLKEHSEKFNNRLDIINSKLDIFVTNSSEENILNEIENIKEYDIEIKKCFDEINSKIDVIVTSDSTDSLIDEIEDVKNTIIEYRKAFESSSDEKLVAIDKYLKDVLFKLDNVDIDKNVEDIKNSVLNAVVSIADQISFVEETEDIKDFVEEKTELINQNIKDVQNQLKQLSSSDDAFDYTYTLQDVESDIARLRIAINNIQGSDFTDFSNDIKKIIDTVENIESSLTHDQIIDLKSDIEKLNDEILSISSRTNKLLINSDDSFKALNDGINNFNQLIFKLEEKVKILDDTSITERIERKVDNIHSLALNSSNSDKVFHQAMMYLGEWVDATTENISSISDKTSQIQDIYREVQEIKENIPERDSLLEEINQVLPNEIANKLISKFQLQEERIDALENRLDKVLSILEEKDDTVLNRKMDKIEKIISKLDNNIEKLTSYVDE